MCAIFGSSEFGTYKKLYDECKQRGNFAYGSLYMCNPKVAKNLITLRSSGEVTLSKNETFTSDECEITIDDIKFFLGHTQAPTSSVREFDPSTSHPFSYGDWIVAHNGVLTNHLEIQKNLLDKHSFNEVDSSVIPALITQLSNEGNEEIESITGALSKLKGTFGLWIFHKPTGHIYLARSGSTLYADFLTNDFSSLRYKKFQALEEGSLYLITSEGLTTVGYFAVNSPFFTL
jgi:glucosamine 6-phosphate synthetase-like amidotransferase/phosphosugar isomerase protein